jgi:hypothetical protein
VLAISDDAVAAKVTSYREAQTRRILEDPTNA